MNKKILLGSFLLISVLALNCTSEKEPVPSDCENPPSINLVSSTEANCNQSNGSITVAGTGGEGDLTYQITGGTFQSSPLFDNLVAGNYTITVKDANNCTAELQATVLNSDGINIQLTTVDTNCDTSQGSITVAASGAQGAVEYKLDNGAFQSSNQFTNLAQGNYTITARDASGCETEQQASIKTDVRFSDVQLIVQNNCAVSGCHDGSISPDMRTTGGIQASANRIKIRTSAKTMPPSGRSISDAQIAAIACWVDDGASSN